MEIQSIEYYTCVPSLCLNIPQLSFSFALSSQKNKTQKSGKR